MPGCYVRSWMPAPMGHAYLPAVPKQRRAVSSFFIAVTRYPCIDPQQQGDRYYLVRVGLFYSAVCLVLVVGAAVASFSATFASGIKTTASRPSPQKRNASCGRLIRGIELASANNKVVFHRVPLYVFLEQQACTYEYVFVVHGGVVCLLDSHLCRHHLHFRCRLPTSRAKTTRATGHTINVCC